MHMCFFFLRTVNWRLEVINTVRKDTTKGQVVSDMGVCTRSPFVEGWSFHSLQHSASMSTINRERFKKDFVDLCITACLHVGLMCIVCRSPTAIFFLHVCSTCSSHISANIYTGCKTLLISLPCLLSCSFSQPTLTLTFFHTDRE